MIGQQAHYYDLLTGLPNRDLFQDRLQHEIDKMQRAGQELAVLVIELDRCQAMGDPTGHARGALLLAHAALRICACVRGTDTVARLGDKTFAVLMSGLVTTERVGAVAREIVDTLTRPFQIDGEAGSLSASVGIALYPADGTVMAALLRHADQAMSEAKHGGAHRFRYFSTTMQAMTLARLQLIRELREALASEQFEIHVQPIVHLTSGRIVKAQALLRWPHPSRGLVSPSEFIPAAEECGLIGGIGEWVFRQAATWAMRRQRPDRDPFQLCVNQSLVRCGAGGAPEAWVDLLQDIGLPGEALVIEVTESLLLSDRPAILETLRRCRRAGMGLAIDDFGTGHSALSSLRKFDVDYLKLDGVLIRNLATDEDDRALVEAIIVMAHRLGIEVIAAGVDTPDQRDRLLAAGCDYAQGFLYAPPTPVGDIDW